MSRTFVGFPYLSTAVADSGIALTPSAEIRCPTYFTVVWNHWYFEGFIRKPASI